LGSDVEAPVLDEQIELFEAWLTKEPERLSQLDAEQMELRRALGVT
jgi:hypothetical protein